jgi:peptidoglycan/LPS O-acetylase OafA/YrhL
MFTTPPSVLACGMSAPAKVPLVEYLRGIASLGVAWFHIVPGWGAIHATAAYGWLGVPVFFVISGFVLPLSIWGHWGSHYRVSDFGRFAERRIIRIEPPYLISVLLAVVLWQLSAITPGFHGQAPNVTAGQVLSHVAYLPPIFGYAWLQPVYWTLAYEFCFYAVVGAGYPALIRWPVPTVAVAATPGTRRQCRSLSPPRRRHSALCDGLHSVSAPKPAHLADGKR